MFDHIQITVEDLPRNLVFYEAVLGALGYKIVLKIEGVVVGFGNNLHDMFEVAKASETASVSKAIHIAFIAKNEDAVRAFHKIALEYGAKDNFTFSKSFPLPFLWPIRRSVYLSNGSAA